MKINLKFKLLIEVFWTPLFSQLPSYINCTYLRQQVCYNLLSVFITFWNYKYIMEVTDPSISNHNTSRSSNHEPVNNFGAFKQLKQTEEQYELLRNRIKVLKINDESYKKKMQNNQNKIQKLELIRNQTQNGIQQMNNFKKSRLETIEEQREKNLVLKQSILANSQANLESLLNKKVQMYEQRTKQLVVNEKKIEKYRLQSVQQKVAKHNAIMIQEQKSKQNIQNFGIKKTKTIHEGQAKQNAKLQRKKEKKRAQIEELEKIEMQVMKKYSQSHIAFKSVKNKLDQMLGKIQNKRYLQKI